VLRTAVSLRVRYIRSGRSALGQRLVLRFSENNVSKLKNKYKFAWFVEAKIHNRKLVNRGIGVNEAVRFFSRFEQKLVNEERVNGGWMHAVYSSFRFKLMF
jgi:hypothetical protein